MKSILVSLVSEQTIPNILAIHHFKPDELLFISTQEMEKKHKTRHILDCLAGMGLDYEKRFAIVEIMEYSSNDCHRKLDEWITGREECSFTVNLTGGTKIMSISTYDYFKDLENRRMLYIPFPKNEFIAPFTKRAVNRPVPLLGRLKVADYLAAYGLKIINRAKIHENEQAAAARKELTVWIVQNYEKIKNMLGWLGSSLRKYRDKKTYLLKDSFSPGTVEEQEFIARLGFNCHGNSLSRTFPRSEIQYLTGGWLEEYCFQEIRELVGRGVDDTVTGIKIRSEKGTENEFDVMFTKGNALYTVECKSLDQNDDKKADALYKIAALHNDFGLRVESFFVSTSPHILRDGLINPAIMARAEKFRTTVISSLELPQFGGIVREKLGIN